jgi:oligoendopeptidase F
MNNPGSLPQDNLTTSQLLQKALESVEQMSPEEKARVRNAFDQQLQKYEERS